LTVKKAILQKHFPLIIATVVWRETSDAQDKASGNVMLRYRTAPFLAGLLLLEAQEGGDAFSLPHGTTASRSTTRTPPVHQLYNIYDDWRSDAVVDTMFLDEDNVRQCLEEFVESEYGKQMFGCHERPSSIGVTGSVDLVEVSGPEVTLTLDGKFWHRRDTVLGRAAMWLNARMPEITDVMVADQEELKDFEEVLDDFGEVY